MHNNIDIDVNMVYLQTAIQVYGTPTRPTSGRHSTPASPSAFQDRTSTPDTTSISLVRQLQSKVKHLESENASLRRQSNNLLSNGLLGSSRYGNKLSSSTSDLTARNHYIDGVSKPLFSTE